MTRIRMLALHPVSPNGLVTMHWPKDSEHVVSDELLDILIDAGVCEIIEDKAVTPQLEAGDVVPQKPRKRGRPRNDGK